MAQFNGKSRSAMFVSNKNALQSTNDTVMLSSFPHQVLYQSYPTFPLHSGDKASQFPETFVSKNGDIQLFSVDITVDYFFALSTLIRSNKVNGADKHGWMIFLINPDCA